MKIKITHAEAMIVGSVLADHAAVMDIDGKIYEIMTDKEEENYRKIFRRAVILALILFAVLV